MIRRFEFVGGKSAKYWEASLQGQSVTVRYGRLGTPGQLQVSERCIWGVLGWVVA